MTKLTRRQLLYKSGGGFGALALAGLLQAAPAKARAKHIIYLFMHGGASHVDTFDYKPELTRNSGKPLSLELARTIKTSFIHDPSKAILRGSPWQFRPGGKSGLMISDIFPHVRDCADDLAVIKSVNHNVFDHAPAIYFASTGSQFPGRACLGSWVTYGLGTENQDLPAFVVMQEATTKSGPPAYSAGFLPAVYQGTMFRGGENPILYLKTPEGVTPDAQKETLGFIDSLDEMHRAARVDDSTLEARISAYELAFRMQSKAPEAVDISKESEATRKLYGIGEPVSDSFGRKCLLARRLVQRGVRFVQLFSADWDGAHTDLLANHTEMGAKTDKPIAGLLADLKATGLLDETLVVWGGDFGRTPLGQGANGRDHHPYGFTIWMAGAGIKGGQTIGATDEFGVQAVETPLTVHDVNATILRLMGLDHEKLTWLYQGRNMRITDVHGEGEFTKQLVG